MKKLLTLFFVCTVAFLVSSCATSYPNQKKLIGTWKVIKIEKYDIPSVAVANAATAQKAKTGDVHDTSSAVAVSELSKRDKVINRMMEKELHSSLTINKDQTAVKELPGKTVHATWKLKNKGTRLLIDSKEEGKKMTIDILHINDTSAVVLENLPVGGLKVTYKKEKK